MFYFYGHYVGFWHSVVKVFSIIVEENSASIIRVNELGYVGRLGKIRTRACTEPVGIENSKYSHFQSQ